MKPISKLCVIVLCAAILLAACGPATPTTGLGFGYIWYVSLSGDDHNACDDPARPCLTVEGALQKARSTNTRIAAEHTGETVSFFHTINVAAGTYMVTGLHEGYPFANANLNVTVVGAAEASTIFDAANTYGGIYINGDVNVALRNFTVRNVDGSAPDSCINIRGNAEVTIEQVTVEHCVRNGINHLSTGALTLTDVTATDNITDGGGNGNGVASSGDMTIEGGNFSGNGGRGVSSGGSLSVSGAMIENNQRDGVVITRTATITDTTIQNNGQDGSFRAGIILMDRADVTVQSSHIDSNQYGVWQQAGTLRLIDSVVGDNPRTGIVLEAGELRLTNSSVQNNGSFYTGTSLPGGIAVDAGASAILTDSQVTGNLNGGIVNNGELFLIESSITENSGGGVALLNAAGATAVVERSLIANNTINTAVTTESALENRGDMTVLNTTISGNNKNGVGGVSGSISIAYSTIAENGGIGLNAFTGGSVVSNVANTIIAKNTVADCAISSGPSGSPLPTSGTNMDTDGTCGFPETFAPADILLDVLADNGGPTLTHALLPGSPAIEAATGSCPSGDQRNIARPFGPSCDVGAYEAGGTALSLDTGELEISTVTPTADKPELTVTIDTGCFFGPGPAWGTVSTLKAGTQAAIVGQGFGGGWMVVKHPDKGVNCWVEQTHTKFDVPLDTLRLIAIPDKPTATPEPTKEERATACPTAAKFPFAPLCN